MKGVIEIDLKFTFYEKIYTSHYCEKDFPQLWRNHFKFVNV